MSKTMQLGCVLAAVVVTAALLTGCSGGFGPTLPSPDEGGGPPPLAGDICGTVTDGEGAPIAGALVTASNGEDEWTATTDANGEYCLDGVASGAIGMTVGAAGFETEYRTLDFDGEATTLNVTMDAPVEGNPSVCPEVTLASANFSETGGTVEITGTVSNTDADSVILFQDGQPSITGLTGTADPMTFTQLVFLHPGANVFVAMVGNATCTVLSEPLTVNWTPPQGSDFYFRVTLTWNTPTSDADLHVWSPDNQHSSFWNKAINAGQLDVDDIEGFGPENFTNDTLVPGRFRVAIDSYDLDEETTYDVVVRVVTGGLAPNSVMRTFGPHTFTTDDGETYPVQPPNWWRPFDVVVAADGAVSVVAPDNAELPEYPSGTLAQASAAARSK